MTLLTDSPSASVSLETDAPSPCTPEIVTLIQRTRDAIDKAFNLPGVDSKKRVEYARKLNQGLQRLEFKHGVTKVASRPSFLDLPVAGKCNLRCTMCGLSHGNPQYPNWTLEEVKRFEGFLRFVESVNPTGAGEPLTNKDFFPILELFQKYQPVVGFYTNATLLNKDKAERLLRSGVSQVNISIDGATKETFERVRKYATYETVVGNVRELIRRRNELGFASPRVQIAMVLMRDTMHELPALVRLAADLGADSVYTMFVSSILPDQLPELEPARTNGILREARKVAAEHKLLIAAPGYLPETSASGASPEANEHAQPVIDANRRNRMCSYPWNQYVVWNDGDVSPCCRIRGSVDGKAFGNIHQVADPETLWNSEGMVRLRERLASGKPPKECVVCPIRTLQM